MRKKFLEEHSGFPSKSAANFHVRRIISVLQSMTSTYSPIVEDNIRQVLKQGRFVVGAQWLDLPVRHDILRNDYWIYNEEVELDALLNGASFKFIKLQLPDEREAETIEWRVIDLMNNFRQSHTTVQEEISDLAAALRTQKLNQHVMIELARKYGTKETKRVLKLALVILGLKPVGL